MAKKWFLMREGLFVVEFLDNLGLLESTFISLFSKRKVKQGFGKLNEEI